MKRDLVLAIDCGTTGNRAIVFDRRQRIRAQAYREFTQHYPKPGWVEHDALEIWASVLAVIRSLRSRINPGRLSSIGLTNQRETLVVWDPRTGKPAGPAIVWQCRRSAGICQELKRRGLERRIHHKTGLFLDPYFTGTKALWLVRNRPAIARGLRKGALILGTIDAWVLWKLTGGQSFSTDPTNASRTLLMDIHRGEWDTELVKLFGLRIENLPRILPSSQNRARSLKSLLGEEIPIAGVVGDQQSASFAQGTFRPGVIKNTYGTGLFLLAETGARPLFSKNLITTLAAHTGQSAAYALEGSVFIGGASIQWLRDKLKLIASASETSALALSLKSNDGVYFVPALAGLGAPDWDPTARGLFIGLTRQTGVAHLVRAALEAMAYGTYDVVQILKKDLGLKPRSLSVDGGAVKNEFLMQFQSDILGVEIERPSITETTALGAAGLAGIATGLWKNPDDFLHHRAVDKVFKPGRLARIRRQNLTPWRRAVERAKHWIS